jgi:hypothetical protein
MFERFLYRLVYILFGFVLWMSMTNPAKADVNYETWYCPSWPCPLSSNTLLSSGTWAGGPMNYNWGSGEVLDSGRSDYVVVHLDGYITVPIPFNGSAGDSVTVTFYNQDDDGSLLKIDGTTVIDDWSGLHAPATRSGTITLQAGETYSYERWFAEWGGGAVLRQMWLVPGYHGSWTWVSATHNIATTIPTPTYSSDPTAAQLQSRTDSRNITSNGNQIYITQSGNNLDLDIVQYDNDQLVAGTSSTANNITDATITGDDNTVNITQGNNAGSFSDDNVTLLDVNGTNNSITVRQGDNVDDVGGHRSSTNVVGNYNTLGILQENDGGVGSNGHYMEIDVAGNSNTMYMDQKDDGDKMLFLDVNGSSNDVDILQQGTGEHFLDITAGSNQTIDINQDGSGSHAATIDMSGYSSTLDLDQTGSTDQTYSLTQICTNANGCGTTTINQN